MAIDPISWTIIAVTILGAVSPYWNEIKAWANRAVAQILDTINQAVEVVSDVAIYLLKEKNRYYKQAETYIMNINNKEYRFEIVKESIELSDIPEEFRQQLEERAKIKLMTAKT
ncbi:MAG: hypothetical protein P5702_08070 [Limnospira sp. PMC 1291.21]|uniref:Holin n=1 Tax=Limnospira fusiformis PMC 851.14 TaxID=2219512 RepID=A0ABU9EQT3_LIMFS|nr:MULTISPECIES: hypothetical protein [Limnospira]EKD10274.1 hypothetical protein SPLC1_S103040 [Arthrospira platensis C1]RAQ48384.1 hypothetical protein B9S53_02500 [Arthrospira sp. O9.13F]MDT9177409.1 hypothetical protein [Limnospira sp. PMC 1238.20]MDT9192668.1 hypothetical protein [Limnospira sp. PMC 1245.20]MDT9197754.1 hypothetical protein [Limnospira sp. PMC 1042.18]